MLRLLCCQHLLLTVPNLTRTSYTTGASSQRACGSNVPSSGTLSGSHGGDSRSGAAPPVSDIRWASQTSLACEKFLPVEANPPIASVHHKVSPCRLAVRATDRQSVQYSILYSMQQGAARLGAVAASNAAAGIAIDTKQDVHIRDVLNG
jgi:hypothetical protein